MEEILSFGEWLQERRKALDLTREELARLAGCSAGALRKIEADERKPSKELAGRLVDYLALDAGARALFLQSARGQLSPAQLPAPHSGLSLSSPTMTKARSSNLRSPTTPLETLNALPNNLPIQLTSFIGRETQLTEIKRLLETTHLLTLTGVGGTGKTRLALQVAADVLEDFSDGAWLVQFAPISDPADVPNEVASALGIREVAGRSFLDLLKEYLHHRSLLLVLDNCEHLIEASGQLADTLLHAAPHLKIVATSREALGIAGETTFPVPSLVCPPSITGQSSISPDDVSRYEAVRLFVDRARAVQPTFRVTIQNAAAVAQLCARLDGIPLALELAAARVRGLSAEQIASHLDDRFRLLTGGSRTALPRQRTLQAAIDWSYNLLTEDERTLLRRLSVFSGSFALDAAEYVCAGDGLGSHQILDLLLRLVDKSLVVADGQSTEMRYHLFETIRQYGQEKLADFGEGRAVRDRHLEYFVNLVEEGEVKAKSAAYLAWNKRLEIEQDNLRAAMGWALANDVEKGLRIAGAMGFFWLVRGYFTEGRDWANRMLAQSDQVPAAVKIKALFTAGFLAVWQSDLATAHVQLEQSARLSEEIGDKQGLAYAYAGLGHESLWRGDLDRAKSLGEKSVALFRESGDKWDLAEVLQGQSTIAVARGDYARARALAEESLMLYTATGDRWSKAAPLFDLGRIAYHQGEYVTARQLYEECLALWGEVGDTNGCALVTNTLGEIARVLGDYAQAAAYYNESIKLTPMGGDIGLTVKRDGIATKKANLGFAVLHQEDDAHALALFRESILLAQKSDDQYTIAICLIGFAGVALARREDVRAARLLGATSTLLETSGIQLEPVDGIELDSAITMLHAQLDDAAFAKAWEEGQSLTLEQAIASANQD